MQEIELINPLIWVGEDRLVLKDITRYGLNRRVVARRGDVPNVYEWLMQCNKEANEATVYHWLIETGDFYILWIVWKKAK